MDCQFGRKLSFSEFVLIDTQGKYNVHNERVELF